jgi:membrane-associated phospholipid phosphatase
MPSLALHYEIHRNGRLWANMHDRFRFFHEDFKIETGDGSTMRIKGDTVRWYFSIVDQSSIKLAGLTDACGLQKSSRFDVHPVLAPDVTITKVFQENQSPWLRTTMVAVSAIGDIQVLSAGLVVFATVIFWLVDLPLEAIMIIVVSATSGILDALIKSLVARPRPTARLVDIISAATGNSFPSGHVMSYVAFWDLLFSFGLILFKGSPWWRITLLILSGLLVLLVGPSRVYLGAHWTSDVLGAYMLGGVCLGIWLWIYLYLYLKGKGILAPRPNRTSYFR